MIRLQKAIDKGNYEEIVYSLIVIIGLSSGPLPHSSMSKECIENMEIPACGVVDRFPA